MVPPMNQLEVFAIDKVGVLTARGEFNSVRVASPFRDSRKLGVTAQLWIT